METEKKPDESIGIVLGGGGVLGDFQVGALKFLLQFLKDNNPKSIIISGTSVGAFNAAGIATAIASKQDTSNLENLWLEGVMSVEDLYEYEEWFGEIEPLVKALIQRQAIKLDELSDVIHDLLRILVRGYSVLNIGKLLQSPKDFNLSLLHQESIRRKFGQYFYDDLNNVFDSNIILRLAAVNLEEGKLEYFCNKKCPQTGANGSDPVKQIICETRAELLKAVFASASIPGLFKPRLINGNNYVDGSARECVALNSSLECGADKVYVIPCFSRTLKENPKYLLTNKTIRNWRHRNFLDIINRTFTVVLNEMISNDLVPQTTGDLVPQTTGTEMISNDLVPQTTGTKKPTIIDQMPTFIIDPIETVHDFFEFDPGLIKINMDYGYMRAFDKIKGPLLPQTTCNRCNELTREIILLRCSIWKAEEELIHDFVRAKYQRPWRYHSPYRILADTKKILIIRKLKRKLEPLVTERINLAKRDSIPDNPEDMYKQWELHNWDPKHRSLSKQPVIQTPWDRLDRRDLGSKDIDAETPPP